MPFLLELLIVNTLALLSISLAKQLVDIHNKLQRLDELENQGKK